MTDNKIQDFGQKIGGAKKDLAQKSMEMARLLNANDLATQPLSKVFPRPDFIKMYNEKLIDADTAIKLQYIYDKIGAKPRRTYALQRWTEQTLKTILLIVNIISKEPIDADLENVVSWSDYAIFCEHMKLAEWLKGEYNPYPYTISQNYSKSEYWACKGGGIYKRGSLTECIEYIKSKTGDNKKVKALQFSVYQNTLSKEYYITPYKKSGIKLKNGFTTAKEAFEYLSTNREKLEAIYKDLRNLPNERKDWNRPRVGADTRQGSDISPAIFNHQFPFRGVEFGNYVNQLERAASLNEAYDALSDLATVLDIPTEYISLSEELALAFGARGSGNAMAHYEPAKIVVNLTKTKGAGSLAHEWFHALDNSLGRAEGERLSYATDNPKLITDEEIRSAITQLRGKINDLDFSKRSKKCDDFRSKAYWSTMIEMTARAFEKYIIYKLAEKGCVNDYLANIVEFEDHPRKEYYPYPTKAEIIVLAPYFDQLLSRVFVNQEQLLAV